MNDITATCGILRQELRDAGKGKPADAQQAMLMECGLNLLERFLLDVNRIADAIETLARIEMARDKWENGQ